MCWDQNVTSVLFHISCNYGACDGDGWHV
jgi:hypothetical protein